MNWWIAIFVLFVVAGSVLSVYGLKKKSALTKFFGISFILIPIFYAIDWLRSFVPFIPLIALGITYLTKQKLNSFA